MGLNNMSEFTLLTALNGIKKHLLVTVVLFIVTYWLLPSLNIIDNRYSMQKTINLGTYEPPHHVTYLNFSEIHAIVSSTSTAVFLSNNLENGRVAQYKVSSNEENNIVLELQSKNSDTLIKTANLVMERLQEFDESRIQKKIIKIDKAIAKNLQILQIFSISDKEYIPTQEDIEQYASMQKIYDTAYEVDGSNEGSINFDEIVRLKREEVDNKIILAEKKMLLDNDILMLEEVKKTGFKTLSYLFPVSRMDISKYYPNDIIFFGISLLVAFFYNLIMLNFLYIKNRRSI